jgi:hypothetical protein
VCGLSDSMRRKSSTPLEVALAELAGSQWGVVSLAQLRALGIGPRGAQHRAQTGRLRRVHRGVYAVGGAVVPQAIARANGHRGTRTLATAIASDPQFTRSELEVRMRKLVQDHDLPQAVFNISLAAHDHKPYEVDCYFPTHRRGRIKAILGSGSRRPGPGLPPSARGGPARA